MRKLSITLVLIAISLMAIEVSALSRPKGGKRIILKTWKPQQKTSVLIPVGATIENNYIKVQFFVSQDNPATFQVKDGYGNILFQDIVVPNEQENYTIRLDDLKAGRYELLYLDEEIELIGEFEIEQPIP